jgi:DNA repair protein RadA/Sms
MLSHISEFDRVCGGGVVPGSAILVGGDPGIGKSTVLLQVCAALSNNKNARCVYISGEEAIDQVRMRAERLELSNANVELASATNVRDIVASLDGHSPPTVVIIDSIQTLYVDNLDSAPGSVTQVRASAQELIRIAKRRGFALFLVGHVTKEGNIAGPKILEHMVDCVLYFEGERGHQFRVLRAVKNRFGPADEIGVFEMTDSGLTEVPNPSAIFLADRENGISGSSVFAGIEGSRPMLMEIQALTASTTFGTPRRAVIGWDSNRLSMIIAVLEAKCGLSIGDHDVYLNVAGGLRISEPAADLAVAAALVSSINNVPIPSEVVVFGEIGLSGEIRPVSHGEVRLKEASKLGFRGALAPALHRRNSSNKADSSLKLNTVRIKHLGELLDYISIIPETNYPNTSSK